MQSCKLRGSILQTILPVSVPLLPLLFAMTLFVQMNRWKTENYTYTRVLSSSLHCFKENCMYLRTWVKPEITCSSHEGANHPTLGLLALMAAIRPRIPSLQGIKTSSSRTFLGHPWLCVVTVYGSVLQANLLVTVSQRNTPIFKD